MNTLINELINYGIKKGLIAEDDKVFISNSLIALFGIESFSEGETQDMPLPDILKGMCDYAVEKGIIETDTVTNRDLFDTKIMGLITPLPSTVRAEFNKRFAISPKEATDWYYDFSQNTNYIRRDRISKDEKWTAETPFGDIDITINLSKPEYGGLTEPVASV